jgi:hypothetical protein
MADNKEIEDNIKAIQNSEDLLNLSNQILNSYDERVKSLGKLTAEEKLYRATVSQQQKLSQQIAANADKYLGYQIKSKDLAKDIKATQDNLNKSTEAFKTISKKIALDGINALAEKRKLLENQNNLQGQIDDLALKNEVIRTKLRKESNQLIIDNLLQQVKDNNKIADSKEKELQITNKQIDKQTNIAKSAMQIRKDQKESQIAQQKELDFLRKNLEIRKQIEKSTGLLGAFSKSLSKIPGIGQYLNADEAIEEMEKLAASIEEAGGNATSFGNRLKIAGKGLSVLAKGFYENIKSPEAIITFFLKAAITANKESVNLSKNLGYGAANADRVRANFVNIERSSDNLNVTTANLSEAFNQLSESTGFVTEYSADALETQIKLTKQLGLTGDEAAGVYRFSVLTGQSSEATYQSMLKGYVATRNSLNVGVPFKAAMAEAAKVTGQLAANMGYNAENTIRGVVATRALGTSLEQAKSQGEKLLDFQSSIESELKAELITGQQLNLERARAAALMGDQVTVANELANQGMTAAKFSGMNVIAQKSFAEALGTTSDELANQLAKREEAIASGKSLAQVTAEEAEEAAERRDIQEQFNAAMLKLQSIIGNLAAGPLGTMLEMLSKSLEVINKIGNAFSFLAGPLQTIAALWLSIKGIQLASFALSKSSAMVESVKLGYLVASQGVEKGKLGIQTALNIMKGEELAVQIGIAAAWAVANPLIALVGVGVAAAVAAGLYSLAKADDMVSPGYGKRTILSPEGAIQLNDKDTIVAGTNLGGGKSETIKSSTSVDFSPMIDAINQTTAAINELKNKSWDVHLDSKAVGTGLIQKSYRSA